MRRIYITFFLCMLFACDVCMTTASAVSMSMETATISAEEKTAILDKIELQVIHEESIENGIYCFDVSQDGAVALGFGARIYVYDAAGAFQYGFRFRRDGAYGIEFQGEQLTIFFLRGNVLATFDSAGNCVDIHKVVSPEQNYITIKELLNRRKKEVAGKHYSLERDFEIGDSYSRLIMKDELGTATILYDASSKHSIGQIALIVFIVGFFLMVIRGCIQKSTKDHYCT